MCQQLCVSHILLAACSLALAQPPDPAYEPLARAYEALSAKDYQTAIDSFQKAILAAPERASIRKDLAYAYLKIGENDLARAQFREAMQLAPGDAPVAMEYAFLCYEGKEKAEARRIFDRLRKTGNAVAEQAFQNIDGPLAEGIARWQGGHPQRGGRLWFALRAGHAGGAARRPGTGGGALPESLGTASGPACHAGGPGPGVEGHEPAGTGGIGVSGRIPRHGCADG